MRNFFRKLFGLNKAELDSEEFQPDAIFLEKQKPGIPLQALWFLLLTLLILGIIWACVSQVDMVVVAEGKVVTTTSPISIQPLERSVIKKVHVKVGDRVKKGDVLFTFDPVLNLTELSKLEERFASLKAERERLIAENDGMDYSVNLKDDKNQDYRLQKLIFDSRRDFYNEKMKGYQQNIEKTEETVTSLKNARVKYVNRQSKVAEVEKMLDDLHKSNVTSTKELLETQASVISMDVQIDELDMQVMSYGHQLMIMKSEMNGFITEWKKSLVEELVDVDREYLITMREITKYKRLVSFLEIQAPCNAVIHEIAPFQEGSAVREAEAIITLIPLDVPLIAEVDVSAKDIGKVELDNSVRIKFDAYPFQQNGTIDGTVIYISEDAFERQQNAANANPRVAAEQKGSFYEVQLSLDNEFEKKKNKILPGMRVVAEIKVGKRRVIHYLINPFIKAMDEAIREP